MEKEKTKRIGKGLFFFGIGSVAAYYFLEITRLQLLPLSVKIQEMTANGEIPEVTESQIYGMYILLLGVLSLLIAPIFIRWDRYSFWKIMTILFLVFADMAAVVVVVNSGKIFPAYILLVWGTFVFFIWISKDILGTIYMCLKIKIKRGK